MWKRWIFQKNSDLLIAGSSLKWKTFVQFDLWKFSVYLWKLHVWENSPSSDIYQNPPIQSSCRIHQYLWKEYMDTPHGNIYQENVPFETTTSDWVWVIPCLIIQAMTPLPLRFCWFFYYLWIMLKRSIHENFKPQLPTVQKLLRFENLTEMGVPFWIYVFCSNYCSSHLSSWSLIWVSFLGVRNPKITLRRLKNKPVLRYSRFQVLRTCDWTGAKK